MKKNEKEKRISFGAIAVSFVFLFNPSISIVDFLPDFIGYIILTLALTKLADLNDTFWEAQKKFKALIIVDAFKLLAVFWAFSMASPNERRSSLLLWGFVFAVLDIVFLVPALIKLFAGMTELGLTYESSYIQGAADRKNPTDRIRKLSLAFVIFRAVVTFLPELTELTSSYYWELMINPPKFDLYRYIGVLRFIALVAVLVFGIIWLSRIISYFLKVGKDKTLTDSLSNAYEKKVLTKSGLFIKRRVNIAGYLFLAAIVASFDFRFDGVNIIPDILIIPLIATALAVLGKVVRVSRVKSILFCTLGGVSFVAYYIADMTFQRKFYNNGIEIIWRSEEAMAMYAVMLALAVFSAAILVLLVGFVFGCYTDVISLAASVDNIDERNAYLTQSFADENKKRLNARLAVCFIIFVAYAVTDVCYAAFSKAFGAMFLINTAGAIAVFITFFSFFSMLRSVLGDKYKLE